MVMAVWFVLTVPTPTYEQIEFDEHNTFHDCGGSHSIRSGHCGGTLLIDPTNEEKILNRRTEECFDIKGPLESQSAEKTYHATFSSTASKLKQGLEELRINDAVWALSCNEKFYQVTFHVDETNTETIIQRLKVIGIGSAFETKLSVLPCSYSYNSKETSPFIHTIEDHLKEETVSDTEIDEEKGNRELLSQLKNTQKFTRSIKSRLAVGLVVEGIRESAIISADFIIFMFLSGVFAAIGLVEDSSVILIMSFLVSPMLGPVLAAMFGTIIWDQRLQWLGIRTEVIGLASCLSFGFLFGICYLLSGNPDEVVGFWSKEEMVYRGQIRSLWMGVLFALSSGAGGALSILNGSIGSLAGVAVSVSLLLQVVNTGLWWSLSLLRYIEFETKKNTSVLQLPETYIVNYSNNAVKEAFFLGVVSLGLTLLNFVCIVFMGIIILKIKEVASDQRTMSRFWNVDIREVRKLNRNKEEGNQTQKNLISQVLHDIEKQLGKAENEKQINLQEFIEEIFCDPVYQTLRFKSAYTSFEIARTTASYFKKRKIIDLDTPFNELRKRSNKKYYECSESRANVIKTRNEYTSSVKLGTVTREKQLFIARNSRHCRRGTSKKSMAALKQIFCTSPIQSAPRIRSRRLSSKRGSFSFGSFKTRQNDRKKELGNNFYNLHDLVP